jgi:murein DD-endopeptidase MepM/ murein hydrolase activator NlpD
MTTMPGSRVNLQSVPARLVLGVSVLLLVILTAAGGAAGAASSAPASSAAAFGVKVVLPGGKATAAGAISSPPQGAASVPSWGYGEGAVSTGPISGGTRSDVEGGSASAAADLSVAAVSLFAGEITVGSVRLAASARASGTRGTGRFGAAALEAVTVLGQPVQAAPNARVPLGDWGYAVLLEQAIVREEGRRLGQRRFVVGLHVHLTADHGGLPAGSEILVGYAEAAASAPKAQPPKANPVPPPAPEPTVPPPGAQPPPQPPIVKDPPPGVVPQITTEGFVFPVYGPASFSDDFGAGRATTGWHHGNDIFAPLGAPLLAVTDGTLFLVGWNGIGGNRLWLRDDEGNEYYYAHLSAFSPLAAEGARVQAGDVVGFMGTSGDAEGTPSHLHFEIHPAGLIWMGYDGVVNPYTYLLAWRRAADADLGFDVGGWQPPPGQAPPPAAVLLLYEDISTVSGLALEEFASFFELPDFGEGPAGPTIVEAEPGFEG